MNKFVCIIGILACALGLEGGYRVLALVNFFNGADAPFYLFTLITFITCIVCFAIFLTEKKTPRTESVQPHHAAALIWHFPARS